jgi:hypothetical protein
MKIALFILVGIAAFLLMVWLVKILWNWLVPAVFKGPRIRFSHALALFILCRLLFGFGFFRGHLPNYIHHHDRDGCYYPMGKDHHWFLNRSENEPVEKNQKNDSIGK